MIEEYSDPVEALFHQALELPAERRAAFLDEACTDAGQRALVEELLAFDVTGPSGNQDFLRSPVKRDSVAPASGNGPAPTSQPILSARLGDFRLLRLLGEGGMGAVYEAEQDHPHRTVALKVIRPGIITPELVQRFTHEAEILGRLHHPGIAQVYQAGVSEDGQPYFAMEFIHGLVLDQYIRLRGLMIPARLELIARVCDAVQHAHERGVIHRDLKPANILVDESGQPRVLDFGVARATDADLQSTTARTRDGQLLGTLSYMSPEQVSGNPSALDHRSDVYALGVILFELLGNRLPYTVEHLPLFEVVCVIRDQEPPRLGSINAQLRGDLETIVAKALAKEPGRRYRSAADLAADIRRHLNHEPILARPPSALYQLGKFARRHKALVGGLAGVLAALVVGLIGTTFFAFRAIEQRGEAVRNATTARENERTARYETYRARIAAAIAALQGHDVAAAAHQLDLAPRDLRGWEWHHLLGRLDDSLAVLRIPSKREVGLDLVSAGPWRGTFTPTGLRLTNGHRRETVRTPLVPHLGDEMNRRRLQYRDPEGMGATAGAVHPDRSVVAIAWLRQPAWLHRTL